MHEAQTDFVDIERSIEAMLGGELDESTRVVDVGLEGVCRGDKQVEIFCNWEQARGRWRLRDAHL